METLRLKIYQPQAHYRIPFTYQRRHTYPIPPYSTVKGFLCNTLGIRRGIERIDSDEDDEDILKLKKLKEIKISICGNFKSKSSEYTWFRNLNKDAHEERFGYPENRKISSSVQHPGGQMPVIMDILNEVLIIIHFYHTEREFLETIKKSFYENISNRGTPLHLGRAEDIVVILDLEFTNVHLEEVEGFFDKFFWIPEKTYIDNNCIFDFNKIGGLLYNLPTFYSIVDGRRNFEYTKVKLNNGDLGGIKIFFDKKENLPIFLFELEENK